MIIAAEFPPIPMVKRLSFDWPIDEKQMTAPVHIFVGCSTNRDRTLDRRAAHRSFYVRIAFARAGLLHYSTFLCG